MMITPLFYILPPAALALYFFYKAYGPRNTEHRLMREILESSRGARLVVNAANAPVFMNSKFRALCKPYGAAAYTTLATLFPEQKDTLDHMAHSARAGETLSVDVVTTPMGHHPQWLQITAQPVHGMRDHIQWRIDDVTTDHQQTRRIEEERTTLLDYSDNAPVGFFSVDEQGRFVFVNATFARWIGYEIKDILASLTLHDLLAFPADQEPPPGTI